METEDSNRSEIHTLKKVVAIVNGSKKLRAVVKETFAFFEKNPDYHLEIQFSKYEKHASVLAGEAQTAKAEIVVVAGGDGTFHEVVNGFDYSRPIPKLILIEAGTGNDFLLGKKQQFSVEKMAGCLKNDIWEKNDLIQIQTDNQTHYSLNIADIGFGGYVIHLLNKQRKLKITGKFSYALAILRAFITFKIPMLRYQFGETKIEGKHLMIAICNGSVFGNGLTINPEAKSTDGVLHITTIGNVSVIDYLKQLPKLKSATKIVHPEVTYHLCEKGRIDVVSGKAYLEADGEIIEIGNQVDFEIKKKAVEIMIF
jgi:diacylglycerol kinase family enzyme